MNSTKTDDREQWRARILRALSELQPEDNNKAQDLTQRSDDPDRTSGAAE